MDDVKTKKLNCSLKSSIFKFYFLLHLWILVYNQISVAQKRRCCQPIFINKTLEEFNLQTFGEKIGNLLELALL